jgi:hypothetical protein
MNGDFRKKVCDVYTENVIAYESNKECLEKAKSVIMKLAEEGCSCYFLSFSDINFEQADHIGYWCEHEGFEVTPFVGGWMIRWRNQAE